MASATLRSFPSAAQKRSPIEAAGPMSDIEEVPGTAPESSRTPDTEPAAGEETSPGSRWERLDELDEPVAEPDNPNTLERLGRLSELGPHGPVGF